MAEWYDTEFNVKSDGFQTQLEASCMSSHTEELRYNETVCLCMTIDIVSKVGDPCRGRAECSLFNSYYTEV